MLFYTGHAGLEIRDKPTETEAWKAVPAELQEEIIRRAVDCQKTIQAFEEKYNDYPDPIYGNVLNTWAIRESESKFMAAVLFAAGVTEDIDYGNSSVEQYLRSKCWDEASQELDKKKYREAEQRVHDIHCAAEELMQKQLGIYDPNDLRMKKIVRGWEL